MATTVTQTVRTRRINATSSFVIAYVYGYDPHVGASATPFSPSHNRMNHNASLTQTAGIW